MFKKKRTWDLIGIALGIVLILVGIVFAANPPDTYSTDSADYASFGGDFYTYQYKATRVVASNTAVTANNLREIGEAQALYFGALFMAAGALTVVSNGRKFFIEDAEEAAAPAETVSAEPEAVSEEQEAAEETAAI